MLLLVIVYLANKFLSLSLYNDEKYLTVITNRASSRLESTTLGNVFGRHVTVKLRHASVAFERVKLRISDLLRSDALSTTNYELQIETAIFTLNSSIVPYRIVFIYRETQRRLCKYWSVCRCQLQLGFLVRKMPWSWKREL